VYTGAIGVTADAIIAHLLPPSLSPRLHRRLAIISRRDEPQHKALKELVGLLRQSGSPASAIIRSASSCESWPEGILPAIV